MTIASFLPTVVMSPAAFWLRSLTRSRTRRRIALEACNRIVSAARQEHFYTKCGITDSFAGRFEMTVIHAVLVLRRLPRAGKAGQDLSQDIFDALFRSFDDSLRARGVGDLSVGKKIKHMGEAFYGRAVAYDRAFDVSDPLPPLTATVERNLSVDTACAGFLARYMCSAARTLDQTTDNDMLAARFCWPTN